MAKLDDILASQRDAYDRVARSTKDLSSLRRLYEDGIVDVQRKIAREVKGGMGQSYSAHANRVVLVQLRAGLLQVTKTVTSALTDSAVRLQTRGLNQLVRNVNELEKHFTGAGVSVPLDEAAIFAGVIESQQPSLMRRHEASMNRYGSLLAKKMERELAVSVVTGEPLAGAIERIERVAGVEWWRAERIVRTETAWGVNAVHEEGLKETQRTLPDMMKRWVEFVDDDTGAAMDNRVGHDSMALHGQVAPVIGSFTMPPDSRVSAKLWGLSWSHPPNRPHDRARIEPWRPHWTDVPAWIWHEGTRTPAQRLYPLTSTN